MSEAHFEAKLYAIRKSKDGVIVSFVCHPEDSADLMHLNIGAHLMIGWAEFSDAELPAAEDVKGILAPEPRAAKGETSQEAPRESGPVAQLDEQQNCNLPVAGSSPAGASKPKRAFKDMPLSQQAGIRCGDPNFVAWLGTFFFNNNGKAASALEFAGSPERYVRNFCSVTSRSELDRDDRAADQWRELNRQFEAWLTDQAYAQSVRR